jgi:SAM-dependent methyltransferase
LACSGCSARFPILGGVALLVRDVEGYIGAHAKGIARAVDAKQVPKEYRAVFREALAELVDEHIEEDLEAERVNALYLMNHYLRVGDPRNGEWWKPRHGAASPLIDSLVREHWDQGPFARIARRYATRSAGDVVELGCGVGGLYRELRGRARFYLGVDSAFASIALARYLALGASGAGKLRVPEDLYPGPLAREIDLEVGHERDGRVDFVVGEIPDVPVADGVWDTTVALNTIDMLEDPAALPKRQAALLRPGGEAVQSCPYVWHEAVARRLRAQLGKSARDSASAVERLYERAGFAIQEREDHVPWLFFKHARQLEVYSVHLFFCRRA